MSHDENQVYILRKPYQYEPNMDIVKPKMYEARTGQTPFIESYINASYGSVFGWVSVITGLSMTSWIDEDELIPLPEDSADWTAASKWFKKADQSKRNFKV